MVEERLSRFDVMLREAVVSKFVRAFIPRSNLGSVRNDQTPHFEAGRHLNTFPSFSLSSLDNSFIV